MPPATSSRSRSESSCEGEVPHRRAEPQHVADADPPDERGADRAAVAGLDVDLDQAVGPRGVGGGVVAPQPRPQVGLQRDRLPGQVVVAARAAAPAGRRRRWCGARAPTTSASHHGRLLGGRVGRLDHHLGDEGVGLGPVLGELGGPLVVEVLQRGQQAGADRRVVRGDACRTCGGRGRAAGGSARAPRGRRPGRRRRRARRTAGRAGAPSRPGTARGSRDGSGTGASRSTAGPRPRWPRPWRSWPASRECPRASPRGVRRPGRGAAAGRSGGGAVGVRRPVGSAPGVSSVTRSACQRSGPNTSYWMSRAGTPAVDQRAADAPA